MNLPKRINHILGDGIHLEGRVILINETNRVLVFRVTRKWVWVLGIDENAHPRSGSRYGLERGTWASLDESFEQKHREQLDKLLAELASSSL